MKKSKKSKKGNFIQRESDGGRITVGNVSILKARTGVHGSQQVARKKAAE